MKILFINLNNTFCSIKSFLVSGKTPNGLNEENRDCFDWISIGLIRKICEKRDIKVVIALNLDRTYTNQEVSEYFKIPVLDTISNEKNLQTDTGLSLVLVNSFTKNVRDWIIENNFSGDYLLLDTDNSMDYFLYTHFVILDPQEGFLHKNYMEICKYFSIKP